MLNASAGVAQPSTRRGRWLSFAHRVAELVPNTMTTGSGSWLRLPVQKR
jgi:hypothetical protein